MRQPRQQQPSSRFFILHHFRRAGPPAFPSFISPPPSSSSRFSPPLRSRMASSVLPVALQNKLMGDSRASNAQLLNLDL